MTKEELRDYVEEQRSQNNIPYHVYSALIDGIDTLEQEPCDDVCEWFEQYVDIATDIVELRFSDGTVKRAKRGLYMRDIEKSIRKMLIDQIANEKKQEPSWIPVSERLPKEDGQYLVTVKNLTGYEQLCNDVFECKFFGKDWIFKGWKDDKVIAWMPLPEPYEPQESEE